MANYINNEEFLVAISDYRKKYYDAIDNEEPKPIMTDYLGNFFMEIAKNLSHHRKFINYSYRDDMISNALFDCARYAHNFNPEKTRNPFAYFTQVAYYAFIRTIKDEKKDLYVKYKVINSSEIFGLLASASDENDVQVINDIGYSEGSREIMDNFVEDYENKLNEKKKQNNENKN